VYPGNRSIVGHKSVQASYSGSHFGMHYSIYWGFDKDGYIIDVLVRKGFDTIQVGEARKTAD
jgi:hypothetical protein